jgi:hypothetical protein
MARGHIQRTSKEPHQDRPSVSLRLDRATKDKLEVMAATKEKSPAALMEEFICGGLTKEGEATKPPDEELRAVRAVVVKAKIAVAKALGDIVESIGKS